MAFEGASPRKLTNIAFLELSRHMTSHERRLADTTITNCNVQILGKQFKHHEKIINESASANRKNVFNNHTETRKEINKPRTSLNSRAILENREPIQSTKA